MIDNLFLNRAPKRLIKKQAENEGTQTSQSKSQLHSRNFTQRTSCQLTQENLNHSHNLFQDTVKN